MAWTGELQRSGYFRYIQWAYSKYNGHFGEFYVDITVHEFSVGYSVKLMLKIDTQPCSVTHYIDVM